MVEEIAKVVNLTNHWMVDVLRQQAFTNCLLVLCLGVLMLNVTIKIRSRDAPLNWKHRATVEETSTAFIPESSKSVC